MENTALDIARRMIQISVKNKIWTSNLKLQKLLYFAWLRYYKKTGKSLFTDEFEAWQYGPVVPSVYYEYWGQGASTLIATMPPKNPVDRDKEELLLEVLIDYKDVKLRDIVGKSHQTMAWKKAYDPGFKKKIDFEDMKEESERSKI